ncbi:MAG: ABC transporter permease [Paracoccaceae bacterium]|jgi:NitT/TauT family transport system permease protein|nr:MAG: ABC transporter permease [Rhodobacter sp. BACL10 MAG-120910-bin24]KRP23860.1 MAG: ABC transporter permease [Rhodobacter sp. BACL10 MAG-120419-bin15]MDA0354165.1 ABC transporter permease [Pseudomonadota bacterium]MDP5351627.1 ABC transporter permease [Paracoccaceae bacterium]MDA1042588.1 ABC transporter permease [Pseudomonadota bacterium]|tara:strand:+ start:3477 stop:4313 length:837 start_codon:yes stop_codon:yes gene_type:complete
MNLLIAVMLFWGLAWLVNLRLARSTRPIVRILVPMIFGITLLVLWEGLVHGLDVSPVILPPPSSVAIKFAASYKVLWTDLTQTFFKGALSGFIIGALVAFLVAIAVDRSPFLKAGVLPIGNFMSALPIVGVAPIMVMWFGFGWQSKAAVVVVMVFFPILINVIAGLAASERMQRDLMATWGASYWQTLFKLRLPAAMPFVFNGLKIAGTLSLIGAIVAEFFGSPTMGIGFRITAEIGRLGLDMIWAEITMAALVGSAFYGVIVFLERRVTFWHPSQRH